MMVKMPMMVVTFLVAVVMSDGEDADDGGDCGGGVLVGDGSGDSDSDGEGEDDGISL